MAYWCFLYIVHICNIFHLKLFWYFGCKFFFFFPFFGNFLIFIAPEITLNYHQCCLHTRRFLPPLPGWGRRKLWKHHQPAASFFLKKRSIFTNRVPMRSDNIRRQLLRWQWKKNKNRKRKTNIKKSFIKRGEGLRSFVVEVRLMCVSMLHLWSDRVRTEVLVQFRVSPTELCRPCWSSSSVTEVSRVARALPLPWWMYHFVLA